MGNFRGPTMVADNYRAPSRGITLNYSDGTAGATTRHYLGTVESGHRMNLDALVVTAFDGTTPSVDIVLEDATGVVLQTLMVAATCAVTVASTTPKVCGLIATAKADVVAKFQRPAAASTAGKVHLELRISPKPGQDSNLATLYSIP